MKNREIKYFSCGEYGDKGGQVLTGHYAGSFIHRPHYHSIVFGLDPFDDNDRNIIVDNWTFCERYIFNKKLGVHGEWLDGQAIDYVTPDNINYVCGYVEKKLIGEKLESEYTNKGLIPPFSLCSQGLGKRYCMDNQEQILQMCFVQRKGHILPIPRQYKKWLGIDNVVAFSPYLSDKEKRHENDKQKKAYEIYNFERIFSQAQEEVEKQFPDYKNKLADSKYYNVANHMFHRIVARRIEELSDLAYKEMK